MCISQNKTCSNISLLNVKCRYKLGIYLCKNSYLFTFLCHELREDTQICVPFKCHQPLIIVLYQCLVSLNFNFYIQCNSCKQTLVHKYEIYIASKTKVLQQNKVLFNVILNLSRVHICYKLTIIYIKS